MAWLEQNHTAIPQKVRPLTFQNHTWHTAQKIDNIIDTNKLPLDFTGSWLHNILDSIPDAILFEDTCISICKKLGIPDLKDNINTLQDLHHILIGYPDEIEEYYTKIRRQIEDSEDISTLNLKERNNFEEIMKELLPENISKSIFTRETNPKKIYELLHMWELSKLFIDNIADILQNIQGPWRDKAQNMYLQFRKTVLNYHRVWEVIV